MRTNGFFFCSPYINNVQGVLKLQLYLEVDANRFLHEVSYSLFNKILSKGVYKVSTKTRNTCKHIEEDLLYPMVYTVLSTGVFDRWYHMRAPFVKTMGVAPSITPPRCPTQCIPLDRVSLPLCVYMCPVFWSKLCMKVIIAFAHLLVILSEHQKSLNSTTLSNRKILKSVNNKLSSLHYLIKIFMLLEVHLSINS